MFGSESQRVGAVVQARASKAFKILFKMFFLLSKYKVCCLIFLTNRLEGFFVIDAQMHNNLQESQYEEFLINTRRQNIMYTSPV